MSGIHCNGHWPLKSTEQALTTIAQQGILLKWLMITHQQSNTKKCPPFLLAKQLLVKIINENLVLW